MSQLMKPELQVGTQAPAVHIVPPFWLLQTTPHAPQLEVVLSGASHPVDVMRSQLPKPPLQEAIVHTPDWHEGVALASEQGLLQPPQWARDVLVLVSQPLFKIMSQLANPPLQIGAQT